jgi:hypothetical protein
MKQLMFFSICIFLFIFGLFKSFPFEEYDFVFAASVFWDGGASTSNWCDAANWSNDVIPTAADDVVINTVVTVSMSTCADSQVNFNTLTVGGSAAAGLLMYPAKVGNAGSLSIENLGVLTVYTTNTLTLSGSLTVKNGGILTHAENTTLQSNILSISAMTITIDEGASVTVVGKGYRGNNSASGSGPGGGVYVGGGYGGGGGHGGSGASGFSGLGGSGYCSISDINTIGSAGAGGSGAAGGSGGGLIKFLASDTITINGTLNANAGTRSGTNAAGGAGGGIVLVADTIIGSPTNISANGSDGSTTWSGGGGGGCISFTYASSNSIPISSIFVQSGNGLNKGGAGLIFFNEIGELSTLYVKNNSIGAITPQAETTLNIDAISITNGIYNIGDSKSLIMSSSSYQSTNGTISIQGTLFQHSSSILSNISILVGSGGILSMINTDDLIVNENASLTLANGSTIITSNGSSLNSITSSGTLNLSSGAIYTVSDLIISGGNTSLTEYSTSIPFMVDTIIVKNSGVLTHNTNTTVQTHVLNIVANNIDIQTGGSINVIGRGYRGNNSASGSGPGGGVYVGGGYGGGGGHGGSGASGFSGAGGIAYCNIENISTIGSAGAGGSGTAGGSGGGLIMLDVKGTLNIDGHIVANAGTRTAGSLAAGGSGGGIKIVANQITGIPQSISAIGSAGNTTWSGGGGGGCISVMYSLASVINSVEDVNISGGTGRTAGNIGLFNITQINTQPTVLIGIPQQETVFTGSSPYSHVIVTSTITDLDLNDTSLMLEYSLDGVSWFTPTIFSASSSVGSVDISTTGTISGIETSIAGTVDITIVWDAGADISNSTYNSNVLLRFIPNDGTVDGDTVTSTSFIVDFLSPTIPGDIVFVTVSTSSLQIARPDPISIDPNFLGYAYFIYTSSSVFSGGLPEWDSSNDANLLSENWNGAETTVIDTPGGRLTDGFLPNTTYYVQLVAFDVHANLSFTNEASTTTHANIPQASTFGGSGTSTIFMWEANSNPNGTIYEVEHINSGLIATTTELFYIFDNGNFEPGTSHEFRVRAKNNAGVYTNYEEGSLITPPIAPSVPVIMSISTSSIDIFLDDEVNGLSTTYAIYAALSSQWINTDGTFINTPVYQSFSNWGMFSTSIVGLTPNTPYAFLVRANTEDVFFASSTISPEVYTLAVTPTNFVTTTVSTSSISFSWGANGNPSGTIYTVSSTFVTVTTTDTTITITGLPADLMQTFELFATNGGGIETERITISEKTLYLNYVPVISQFFATQVNTDLAHITLAAGDFNAFFLPGIGITHTYEFSTSSSNGPWQTITFDGIATNVLDGSLLLDSPTSGSIVQSLGSTNGTPENPTQYNFTLNWDILTDIGSFNDDVYLRVITDDSYGGVVLSTTTIFIDTAIPEVPNQLTIDAFTTTSMTLSWNDTSTNESSFIFEYIEGSDGNNFPGTTIVLAANTTSTTVVGLEPNTQYSFRIAAQNDNGISSYTTPVTLYTAINPPQLTITNKTTSSVDVVLTSTDNRPFLLAELTNLTINQIVTSTNGIGNLTGLTPNTTYELVGRMYNEDGVPSVTSSIHVLVTYAVPPESIVVTDITQNSVTLSWPNSGATQYKLFHIIEGTPSLIASLAVTGTTLTDLSCNTIYTIQLVAQNQLDEPSITSTEVSFTTSACPTVPPSDPTPLRRGSAPVIQSKPIVTPSVDATITDELQVFSSNSFTLNNNAMQTTKRTVQAMFSNITNVQEVALSNTPDFIGGSFVPFAQVIDHVLTMGDGLKTVYARLRSSDGGTITLKDTITLMNDEMMNNTLPSTDDATIACPLRPQVAYKTPGSNSIFYVTKTCNKRGFRTAELYFTYFSSWSDVQLTTQTLLNSIPDDTIGFLPLGPRYMPTSGALIKTLDNPKTYLLLQGTLYHIEDEAAAEFQFGPAWATWIEGVDERLLQQYPLSTKTLNTTQRLDGMLIKYMNDPKVYQLATEGGVQVKRWIPTEDVFRLLNFRDDRIVVVPSSEVYSDGSTLRN